MADNTASTKALRLGAALRRERVDRGISLSQFAPQVELSKSQLSRIETGHTLPKEHELGKVLSKLEVTGDRYDEIVEMLDGADASQWLATSLPDQARQHAALVDFETNASAIYEVAPLLVPGLLQVASYARAIMSNGTVPRGEIATRVATRMGRRDVIDPERTTVPAKFVALIDEAVLSRVIGGPAVMVEQLTHLLKVAAWSHADIRIVSLLAGWTPALSGQFSLIDPRADGSVTIAYIENRRSGLILHTEEDVAEYRDSVDSVLRTAMSPTDSTGLIASVIEKMRRT